MKDKWIKFNKDRANLINENDKQNVEDSYNHILKMSK